MNASREAAQAKKRGGVAAEVFSDAARGGGVGEGEVDGAGLTGVLLTSAGFQSTIAGGSYIVTLALAVFAFTTILGWSYYGERCWQYLFSENSLMVYRGLWVLAALGFANVKVAFVWNLSDTLNGLMAVPYLIGLLLLAPMVFKVTREYFNE